MSYCTEDLEVTIEVAVDQIKNRLVWVNGMKSPTLSLYHLSPDQYEAARLNIESEEKFLKELFKTLDIYGEEE